VPSAHLSSLLEAHITKLRRCALEIVCNTGLSVRSARNELVRLPRGTLRLWHWFAEWGTSMTKNEAPAGFSEFSRSYKSNPTIENYVGLRRKHPKETIEVAVTGGLDWLFGNERTLEQFGISADLVAGTLDAEPHAISELSLQLLELIIERKRVERAGKTHVVSRKLAISDHLVNFLINQMLDALDWNGHLCIPRDLIVLIRHQTGGGNNDWDKNKTAQEGREKAILAALELAVQGKTPSIRAIAKELGVNASTVMRWYSHGELAKTLETYLEPIANRVRTANKTASRS
jgi:hypothetical protein